MFVRYNKICLDSSIKFSCQYKQIKNFRLKLKSIYWIFLFLKWQLSFELFPYVKQSHSFYRVKDSVLFFLLSSAAFYCQNYFFYSIDSPLKIYQKRYWKLLHHYFALHHFRTSNFICIRFTLAFVFFSSFHFVLFLYFLYFLLIFSSFTTLFHPHFHPFQIIYS